MMPMVEVERETAEVLVAELGSRSLSPAAAAALAQLRDAIAAVSPSGTQARHDSVCSWSQRGRNLWVCAHGREVTKHPAGWCDGGCCR